MSWVDVVDGIDWADEVDRTGLDRATVKGLLSSFQLFRMPRVIRALIAAFEDDDDLVRWKAVRAIGRIGAPAAAALPLLERMAASKNEHEVVRATAQRAVEQIREAMGKR